MVSMPILALASSCIVFITITHVIDFTFASKAVKSVYKYKSYHAKYYKLVMKYINDVQSG